MKYIHKRNKFFEAIKDELNTHQLSRAKEVWGSDLLNLERAEPTDKIERGKWLLDDEDSKKIVNDMFTTDIDFLISIFDNDKFSEYLNFLKLSISEEKAGWYYNNIMNFDVKKLKFTDIIALFGKYYATPNVKETQSDSFILRNDDGKPILGDDGKIQKIVKTEEQKNEIIWNNNQHINAFALMHYYNELYLNEKNINENVYISVNLTNLQSLRSDGLKGDFQLYPINPMYLYITEKSTDVMNMSVSKFYTSCQELYNGGGHGTTYLDQLIYNLFDPNSIPAFIIYDEPYINENKEKIVDYMPLCRRMIRNVVNPENEDESLGLYFDNTYPERMSSILQYVIEEYTTNEHKPELKRIGYKINLDLPQNVTARAPYLDSIRQGNISRIRGLNTKILTLDRYSNIGSIRFAKVNNITTIEFESSNFDEEDIEEILNKLPKINTVRFKSIQLVDMPITNNKFKYFFDKCILDDELFTKLDGISDLTIKSSKFEQKELYKISIKNLTLLYVPAKLDKEFLDKLDSFSYSEDIYFANKEVIDLLTIKKKLIKV